MTTPDPVEAEIERLRAEVTERSDRIGELEKLRSRPTVIPVRVYWRHHSEYQEPYDCDSSYGDPLKSAYYGLLYMEEDGACSATGVSVGGHLMTMDELQGRYGDLPT